VAIGAELIAGRGYVTSKNVESGTERERRRLPLACSLSGREEADRLEEIGTIFEECLRADGLEDGYEFRFPGSAGWAMKLTEFVIFELAGGPIRLRVRGPEGTKDFVAEIAALRAG
jgi:hypothetical protein